MAKITTEVEANDTAQADKDLTSILDRLNRLEEENAELKAGKVNMFTKGREKYSGPLEFRYKLWGDVPVLSYKTVKKDKTKPLHYKDGSNYVSNHYLELELANNKKSIVEVNDFGLNHTKSDKQKATDQNGREITTKSLQLDPPTEFHMVDESWGDIVVQINAIN